MLATSQPNRLTTPEAFVVLVVDDDRSTRRVIQYSMEREGYKVIEAANGQDAIELCKLVSPDIVLLDAMMPVMDGFETCRQIQHLPGKQDLPVLIVTALEDNDSVEEAYRAGALDYVTKPIHWPVLLQRVRRLLISRQAEKFRDDLIHMIVHDMKNPLASIYGHLELLLEGIDGDLNEMQRDAVLRAARSTELLLDMTKMLLDVRRMEEGKLKLNLQPGRLGETVFEVIDSLNWMAQSYEVKVEAEIEPPTLEARLDWELIRRVLANLISNAIKHSPRDTRVSIVARQMESGEIWIQVKDQGEGIALEDQSLIFDKFTQAIQRTRGSKSDTGLGLTFCKLAVEAHQGRIELDSTLGTGSTFTLVFPQPTDRENTLHS